MKVDAVYRNATFHTLDTATPRARAVAVLHGRVVALDADGGGLDGLDARRVVDLRGATVVPGFHDAHCHTVWYGLTLSELDLRPPAVTGMDELYAAVAAAAESVPEGGWVIGGGYHPMHLGDRHPERHALDRAAPGRKVWLTASSGHVSVVNSAVLATLDATGLTGGRVVTGPDGEPTGVLEEQAQRLVLEQAAPYAPDALVDAIDRAHRHYLAEGITAVQDAGVGSGLVGRGPLELAAYQRAYETGVLRARTTVMPAAESLHGLGADLGGDEAYGLDLGLRTGLGDDRLRVGPVKFFTDGSILGHTAWLHRPYADDPATSGYLQHDEDWLADRITRAHRAGWQVAVHAQGDRAIDLVLDILEAALAETPRADHRHRVEHCSMTTPEAVARIARLGVLPSPQGRFVGAVGDRLTGVVDPEQYAACYRLRSYLDRGVTVPGSSDRPCVEGAPLAGMHDLVNRRTDDGRPMNPAEAVTAAEALRCYTYGSAYAAFRERDLGGLGVGKLADMAVLGADPLRVDPGDLRDVPVLGTVVGGDLVFATAGIGE